MREGILSAIGGTPLIRLRRFPIGKKLRLFAKVESLNPGGSMKDRPALLMLRRAQETGELRPDSVVIESSSGNMGIGLAQACAYLGLRFICVVDPKTTLQNRNLLSAYGAEVEVVENPDPETRDYLKARFDRVRDLARSIKNSYWPNQHANRFNALAHRQTMSEIVESLGHAPDYLFCAVSTCGTLRGCAEFVRESRLPTKIFAVDAQGSVIFGGKNARRLIPGHGAAIRPELFREGLAERHVLVSDLDCVIGCRRLVRYEAILGGGSSGAVLMAVTRVKDELPEGSSCVAILPDRGERYLDTIYCDQWVRNHFGEVGQHWC